MGLELPFIIALGLALGSIVLNGFAGLHPRKSLFNLLVLAVLSMVLSICIVGCTMIRA